jgi:hypothetical protein
MGVPLMAGELHELSVAIGKLQEGQDRLTQDLRDVQEASTEEHRKVHDIVVATSEAVRNLTRQIAEMKPLTDDYREKRAEARGAAHLARALYVTFGGMAGALATKLLDFLPFRPPH